MDMVFLWLNRISFTCWSGCLDRDTIPIHGAGSFLTFVHSFPNFTSIWTNTIHCTFSAIGLLSYRLLALSLGDKSHLTVTLSYWSVFLHMRLDLLKDQPRSGWDWNTIAEKLRWIVLGGRYERTFLKNSPHHGNVIYIKNIVSPWPMESKPGNST